MNLYILRHGIAVAHGTAGHEDDSDRPLTPAGKRKLRRIAEAMRAMELSFDRILASPFVRARQTAEIVAWVFHAPGKLSFSKELAVGGSARALIQEIRHWEPAPQDVLLVGHEPYLSGLVSLLVAGNPGLSLTLKKGGLCKLSTPSLRYGRCAALEWLLTPKPMALMG